MKKETKKINDLSQLNTLLSKEQYQDLWKQKKYDWREQISRKNRRWLKDNEQSELKQYIAFPKVYENIKESILDEKKRNYIIHIITNFLPLKNTKQVVIFREENPICPFTKYKLTDTHGLMLGNRERHIAFSGVNTNVFLSGIGLQELYRFVLDCTKNFDTKEGQIVNFALDSIRNKEEEERKNSQKK